MPFFFPKFLFSMISCYTKLFFHLKTHKSYFLADIQIISCHLYCMKIELLSKMNFFSSSIKYKNSSSRCFLRNISHKFIFLCIDFNLPDILWLISQEKGLQKLNGTFLLGLCIAFQLQKITTYPPLWPRK